jgi:hypothetical protein
MRSCLFTMNRGARAATKIHASERSADVAGLIAGSRVPDAVQRVTLLRRAGTYWRPLMDPGSAAHHFVLRSVRGRPLAPSYTTTLNRFAARVMPV